MKNRQNWLRFSFNIISHVGKHNLQVYFVITFDLLSQYHKIQKLITKQTTPLFQNRKITLLLETYKYI